MSARRALPAFLETPVLLGLGAMAVLAVTMPLGPGGALVAPDLLFCLIVAWVVRRPTRTPLLAVVALGLFGDVVLSRPLGLGALGLMLVVETFRRRAILFHGAPFVIEWAAAVAAFALMLLGMNLVLAAAMVAPPGLAPSLRHLTATAIAYPLVVLGLTWCLGLRAPRAVAAYRLGRLP
jgi:rod shape-determining protein MreD